MNSSSARLQVRHACTFQKGLNMSLPVVKFDESRAVRIFPRPELKQAVFVPIPKLEGGVELANYIVPEWGGVQQFLGDYYAVIKDGKVIYGSAQEQWEVMHVEMIPGLWVKTAIPTAYQATEPCEVITLILNEDNSVRETSTLLETGDWIVRQPGGEVQHIRQEKKSHIYFTESEAQDLGLTKMNQQEFSTWVRGQVVVMSS